MKKNLLLLLTGALSLAATTTFAQFDVAPPKELIVGHIEDAIKHAQEALTAAQQGDAAKAAEHAREARKSSDEVTGDNVGFQMESAQGRLSSAIDAADKGDAAGAATPLQEAISALTDAKNAY